MTEIIIIESIQQKIYLIRRHKVMLDSYLAEFYGVSTKVLYQAVKRNAKRFPSDFMFQLKANEYESLRSQFVTLKQGRGGHRKYLPYVFTEQGVAMLSSVLNSEQAIQVNIAIIRVFVLLRKTLLTNKAFAKKLSTLEKRIEAQDEKIYTIYEAINSRMAPPEKKLRRIGFKREKE